MKRLLFLLLILCLITGSAKLSKDEPITSNTESPLPTVETTPLSTEESKSDNAPEATINPESEESHNGEYLDAIISEVTPDTVYLEIEGTSIEAPIDIPYEISDGVGVGIEVKVYYEGEYKSSKDLNQIKIIKITD